MTDEQPEPTEQDCEHEWSIHHVLCAGELLKCELCPATTDYEVDP